MMKINTPILILTALAAAATSCNKTSTPEAPFDPVVRVAPEVTPQTRGSYTTDNLKEFDLFIHSANSKYSYTNTKFTKNSSVEWVPARQMLWEGKKTKFDFLAVAPSLPASGHSISDIQVFSFAVEEVQTEGSTASDLLWAWKYDTSCEDTDLFDGKGRMKIAFSHACSLIRVKLTLGTEFNHDGVPQSNPISELKIDGLKVAANIQHHILSSDPYFAYAIDGTEKTVQTYQSSWEKAEDQTKNCVAVFECIVVPQNWKEFTVNFICGGKPYTYKAISGQSLGQLESGKAYTLPLTVGKDEVIMSKDGITASHWENGGSKDLETD